MRPGRPSDLPQLLELWLGEVRAGKRDCVPGDAYLRRNMAGFDWEARSRMVEGEGERLDGAVLVSNRSTPTGTVAAVEVSVAAGRQDVLHDLLRWGLALAHAAGAVAAQVWRGRGSTDGLDGLGLELIRPWWRMDRSLAIGPSVPLPVAGYELRDATGVPAGIWANAHNLAFADHWRFSPRNEDELMSARHPSLSLMMLTPEGTPAALTVCQIETYSADRRPQPVGVISSVGTLPEHRRRGLATWLVTEALLRLHRAGARYASLYVDGRNPMRAFDAYIKLGFELAFETEVWEATFR
jgi:ribosomal protein S18 acetylase RimI-like enzyme